MPESRDRIPRPVAELFALRLTAGVGVLLDDQGMSPSLFGSPIMRVSTVTTPVTRGRTALGATRSGGLGRGRSGTPRNVRGWNLSQASGRDIAQSSRRWSGRGMHRNSMLPFWYPRTPLRDITAVVRVRKLIFFQPIDYFFPSLSLIQPWLSYVVKLDVFVNFHGLATVLWMYESSTFLASGRRNRDIRWVRYDECCVVGFKGI